MLAQTLKNLGVNILGDADAMLVSPYESAFRLLFELGRGGLAKRALLRRGVALMRISAHRTYIFCHDHFLLN
jgi:hypothetical protein